MLGLYIHLPLCNSSCSYCDFNSIPQPELEEKYIKALEQHIVQVTERYALENRKVDTIYFGGGTPSIFSFSSLERVLFHIYNKFKIQKNPEVSVEVNPESFSKQKLKDFKTLGFNRISLGIQSLQDPILKAIGRKHTADQAINALKIASNEIENLNIDLIFALPCQNHDLYSNDLEIATKFNIQHLSAYLLNPKNINKVETLPKEDSIPDYFEITFKILEKNNFHQYEISNYARNNYECRHNTKYWTNKEFIGFGAGAHSYLKTPVPIRFEANKNIREFIRESEIGSIVDTMHETLTEKDLKFDFITSYLRLCKGINLTEYQNLFAADLIYDYKNVITKHEQLNNIVISNGYLRLTKQGQLFSNAVFLDFCS